MWMMTVETVECGVGLVLMVVVSVVGGEGRVLSIDTSTSSR